MNLTPIKKILIGLTAVCIAMTLITANNLTSVMMLIAAKNNAANKSGSAVVEQEQGSSSSSGPSSSSSSSSSSGVGSSSSSVGSSSGVGSSSSNTGSVSSNTGSSSSNAGSSSSNDDSSSSNDSSSTNNNTDSSNSGSTSSDSSSNDSGADTNAGNTDAPQENAGDAQTGKKPETAAEIAEYYKTAINKAKTQAKTVTRVKDGAINYQGKVVAGNLSSVAESLMGMFMAPDANSIEVKNEPWEASKLPPEGVNSALTADGIKSATCEENGDNYIVTIVAKDAVNPAAGSDGVGSIASVIQQETITGSISSVPGLELNNISLAYENVTVVATIEKATGNMTALSLDAPCFLSLDAKVPLLGSIDDACVGIEIISEFAMTY